MHGHPRVLGGVPDAAQPRGPYAERPCAGLVGAVQQMQPLSQSRLVDRESGRVAGVVAESERNNAVVWRHIHKGWQQLFADWRCDDPRGGLNRFTRCLLSEFLSQLHVGVRWRWHGDAGSKSANRLKPFEQHWHEETQQPPGQPDNNRLPSRQCTGETDTVFFDIKFCGDALNYIIRCHDALPKTETGQLVYLTLEYTPILDKKNPGTEVPGFSEPLCKPVLANRLDYLEIKPELRYRSPS